MKLCNGSMLGFKNNGLRVEVGSITTINSTSVEICALMWIWLHPLFLHRMDFKCHIKVHSWHQHTARQLVSIRFPFHAKTNAHLHANKRAGEEIESDGSIETRANHEETCQQV